MITHATRPPLRLTARQARRIEAGRAPAGLRLVDTVRQVERGPGAVAVVALGEVGPTVRVATVDGVDPVRDADQAVTVAVVGDVMLVRGVSAPAAALAPMSGLLRAADLTVGNLESTLSLDGEPGALGQSVSDSFGATPALLRPLARAGFDAVSLANNHTGDYGVGALEDTVRVTADGPVLGFGAGTLDEAMVPLVLQADGVRLAFLGFNAIGETPRATATDVGALSVRMPPRTGPALVEADLRIVERSIRAADRVADAVVVLPHWGDQYTHQPEPVQRVVARRLVEAGADLVVGGHPHWVQGVDAVDDVPVAHSLGNFVFDMGPANGFPEQTRQGVVLESTWWGGELKAVRLVPYLMDPVSFAPGVVRGDEAADILGDVWSTSTGPFSAARR